ncbi:hypothetical protein EMPG_16896 [Blastomyces silverae]|uniref:Uncharacterized protein n=1 Tax=Blastomyces silverae TaxID=2060906 RepID=A0A0H1B960_9EURO|nr:hypothetical protein EMPG_16896 [Blastomyces silverae]
MRKSDVAVDGGPLQALGYMPEEITLVIEVDDQRRARRICRGRGDDLTEKLHRMVAAGFEVEGTRTGVEGDVIGVAEEVSIPMNVA